MKGYTAWWGLSLLLFSITVKAQFDNQPFKWNALTKGSYLLVSVEIPPAHYLYADQRTTIRVSDGQIDLVPESAPRKEKHTDEFGAGEIYPAGKQLWKYKIEANQVYKVIIQFQGCKGPTKDSPGVCFMPSESTFSTSLSGQKILKTEPAKLEYKTEKTDLYKLLNQFEAVNSGGGYLNKEEFLAFLDKNRKQGFADSLAGKNILVLILLVLFGGVALNLTPCVLPMIPVNLAIIGAGKSADKKSKGLLRGGVYGFGIALAYGGLGVLTVLSGAKFGALNSTFWFNFIVAGVFIFLALSMFDVFSIDFTKFSTKFGIKNPEKGEIIPIFFMGMVTALLAGACVAPVLIAVLLHSTTLYAEGNIAGLVLPFVLGIGMALPWPFAGAGLASLPKPGKWMVRVKQFLGVMIFLFAGYYSFIGVGLLSRGNGAVASDSFADLEVGLLRAKAENKPVFIDFWASWCKNCSEMEKTTLKDSEVIQELKSYVVVKFQAEKPNQPEIKKLLDRYQLIGLPGYVILKEKSESEK